MASEYLRGVASDFFFIALTRRALQWVSSIESFSRMATIIVQNCLLALVLCFGPAGLGYGAAFLLTDHMYGRPAPFSLPIFAQGLQDAGYVASLSNVITSLAAAAFLV